jgi:hypothetical protein
MREVNVLWSQQGSSELRQSRVQLWEGYSDESDIPAILAIVHLPNGLRDADKITVLTVSEKV